MDRGPDPKTCFIGMRMSSADAEALKEQARASDLTLSELVRRRLIGRPVISRTDEDTAASIDQLGRMLKHLYPKGAGWVTAEERKRWWALVTELERTVNALRRSEPEAL